MDGSSLEKHETLFLKTESMLGIIFTVIVKASMDAEQLLKKALTMKKVKNPIIDDFGRLRITGIINMH
eukprot:13894430-Ditylum_brightwellii.AAC.1